HLLTQPSTAPLARLQAEPSSSALPPPSLRSSPLVPAPCAPPPASWGCGALLLHGKGLRVTLFYSPLQNGHSAREHLPHASGRAGQKTRWRSATPFAHPRCVMAGPLTAYRRGGCGTWWCLPLGRTSPGAPMLDRRTPCTIAQEKSL